MADETTKTTELTGRQDLSQAFYAGASGFASGTAGAFAADCGTGSLFAAVQGSGTYEGTNRYSPPMSCPGGIASFAGMMPGYDRPWPGTYATYRVMNAHPTLVIAMAATFCPVKAGEWFVEADKGVPDEARRYVSDLLMPMRTRIVSEMLWSLAFGWRGFERVKVMRKGYWTLGRLKPLLPELTEVEVDPNGHLAGLRNGGVTLTRDQIVVYTNDQDGDYYYGRSRHENCRRVWSNWLCDDDNLHRLATKAASVIPYVGYPPGTGKDKDGKDQSNFDTAAEIARGMSAGRAVVFPNLANFTLDDIMSQAPDWAKASLWHHGTIDMGDSGPTLMALLEKHQYDDNLLVRGWCKPERSMLQARHGGSRADSESHGDIGTTDCDMVAADIAECVTQQIVEPELRDNGWEKVVGKIRIKAVPIIDEKKIVDDTILDAVVTNQGAFAELVKRVDMDAWLDRTGLPKSEFTGPWDGVMVTPPTVQADGTKPPAPGSTDRTELSAAERLDPYVSVRRRMKAAGHSDDVINSVLSKRKKAS
jgi:hypothetical protein